MFQETTRETREAERIQLSAERPNSSRKLLILYGWEAGILSPAEECWPTVRVNNL